MPAPQFPLHGNVPEHEALAAVQQTYQGRLDGILNDFITHVKTVQSEWVEGSAGREGFDPEQIRNQAEFLDVNTAFRGLSTATQNAGENWQRAMTTITAYFGGGT